MDFKKNYILMVFEGEDTEKKIFDSLKKFYLNEHSDTIVYGFHCGEIYSLYNKLNKDEDLELFPLLQDKLASKNNDLQNIKQSEVSEIYMFFDYDGHAASASDQTLREMLELFDNETEKGKLYISYPMVEAIKHFGANIDFENLVAISEKNYKKIVRSENDDILNHIINYTKDHWLHIIDINTRKLGKLFTNKFEILNEVKEPIEIFDRQVIKHLNVDNKVSVLSAFPIFLVDYYGYDYFKI